MGRPNTAQHIYFAIDNANTIEELGTLNRPLSELQLPNVSIGSQFNTSNEHGIKRRTGLHKWWDYEVMVCAVTGIISSPVGDSGLKLPHFNPDVLAWFRNNGISGVVRGYSGLKFLELPIVKGHTSSGYWNEEFCDDTRLLLCACDMTDQSPAGKFFDTITALQNYILDDRNDILSRDLAECTMLEFFLEAVKQYTKVAQQYGCSTQELLISDLVQDSRQYGWAKVISNVRNVGESFSPKPLSQILKDASISTVTKRDQVLLDVIRSRWYECSGAVISLLKCRAVVRANGDFCKKMPNCVRGNQWLSVYYDSDLCDEISFLEWITLCGFDASMEQEVTGDMSEYLERKHLATDTSLLPRYKGRSYNYDGLTVSRPGQYRYLETEPKMVFDLERQFTGNTEGKLSLCVNVNRFELIVVKRSKKERLLRFLKSIEVTLKLPVVDVKLSGSVIQGVDGPTPTAMANRVISGKYGPEAACWLLSHIFAGNITVRNNSMFRSFLPRNALRIDGKLTFSKPLDGSLLKDFKVLSNSDGRGKKAYYWTPKRVGNVFKILVGKSLVSMEETEDDLADPQSCLIVRVSSHKNIQ